MQPTEHKKEPQDELIAHIKESLLGYEEEYMPGAWEKFNDRQGKVVTPVFWLWRLSAAAAVLFVIGAGIIFFNSDTPPSPVQNVQNGVGKKKHSENAATKIEKDNKKPGVIENSTLVPTTKRSTNALSYAALKNETAGSIPVEEIAPVKTTPSVVAQSTIVENRPEQINAQNKTAPAESKVQAIQDFLVNETRKNQSAATIKDPVQSSEGKWEMGVVVSPSFGNTKKLNMGYGISMGYALTDRLSLNSGLSYNQMAASRNVPAPVTTAIAGESKNLESIEAKVTGIDIPLELKYHISKNIYANVGVSAFAVIDQKQSNSYIQERLVERTVDMANGQEQLKTFAVNERITEEAPEPEIKDGKYIGFYNFSFGYKQKVSKSKSISIEPFMKVPMKDVSKENLRLIGTGVRLKFDF